MVKTKLGSSISVKIFVLSILTGVVVFVAYIYSSTNIFNTIFDELYQEKALSITTSLDAGIGINDLNDLDKLQNLINKFIFLNPDIHQLSISTLDENQNLVIKASNNINSLGQESDTDNQASFESENIISKNVSISKNESGLKTVIPIVLGGQKMGTYEMYLSTQRSRDEFQQQLIVFLFYISLFVFAASIMFFLVVKKTIILPIKKVVLGVDQFGNGDLNYRIEKISNDEIGKLAIAFNDSAARLSDMYQNLEKKVEERTVELNSTLETMENQNKVLENSKIAMINILEDDKELQAELQREKAGVEKKVIDRTKELTDTKAKLDSSIENLPLGFLMVDIEEKLVVTNSLANKILEGKDQKSNLINLKNILKGKLDLRKYIKSCGEEKKRLVFTNIDINDRIFQFLLSPILMGELKDVCIGIVVLIQDITEEKILDRSKDEFFSIASHELRTPLTAIRGNTSMILEYYADAVKDPELKAMVDDIHESSIRLINIVNDFLNVSRLEQKRMVYDLKNTDLNALIPEIIKEYDVTGSRKKLSIDFHKSNSPLPAVLADSDKVRQVLINLLGNALKFTSKGGVTISIKPSDKFIKVLVADTGRGISLKQQSLLFHKFQQAGASLFTRDTAGGSGLGLYISRMMIEGMGGEVKLEKSEVNKGSVFSFSLPVATNKKESPK